MVKKLLIFFVLVLFASTANAGFTVKNFELKGFTVTSAGAPMTKPPLFFLGDSKVVGHPSYQMGYRDNLQAVDMLSDSFRFVGPWGMMPPAVWAAVPENATGQYDYSYLHPQYQRRHGGWWGVTTEDAITYFENSNQLDIWFPEPIENSTIIIDLGANDAQDSPQPSTASIVALISDLIDVIDTHDATITIIVCQIEPFTGYTSWVTDFNTKIGTMVAGKAKTNVYSLDLYTPLVTDWATLSDDGAHPNDAGNAIIAATIYNTMVSIGVAE